MAYHSLLKSNNNVPTSCLSYQFHPTLVKNDIRTQLNALNSKILFLQAKVAKRFSKQCSFSQMRFIPLTLTWNEFVCSILWVLSAIKCLTLKLRISTAVKDGFLRLKKVYITLPTPLGLPWRSLCEDKKIRLFWWSVCLCDVSIE